MRSHSIEKRKQFNIEQKEDESFKVWRYFCGICTENERCSETDHGDRKIVVLSAMSGTTNSLVEISDYLYKKNPDGANEIINKLAMKYMGHVEELYSTEEYKQKAKELIKSHFEYIRTFTKDLFTLFEEKVVLAQGELISTGMMNLYLNECGVKSVLIPALDYMRTDKNAEPTLSISKRNW